MAIVKKEVEVAKEIGDVMVLVGGLLKDIKSGKSAADIAIGNLPKLMEAVSGIDQVGDEVKQNRAAAIRTVVDGAIEIVDALL